MSNALKRELNVAFSRNVQPLWVRILKWVLLIAALFLFRNRPNFWYWVLAVFASGIALHLFYRWKTHAWTRPWGGWNDIDAAR